MKRSFAIVFCLVASGLLLAAPPAWWSEEDTKVIDDSIEDADNYAPANLGQLKHMAAQAKKHLDATLVGDAGSTINALVASFEPRAGQGYTQGQIDAFIAENYAPINLGQLKAVAKPFYDRLLAAGYNTKANLIAHGFPSGWAYDYPWNPSTPVAENYALANLGQLKAVFSFDLTVFDTDADGMADEWEVENFGTLGMGATDDTDGDGVSDLEEFQAGSDPNDYYEQGGVTITPVVAILGGNNQTGAPGEYLAAPLEVEVRNAANNALLENAPVVFTVTAGAGGLAEEDESEWATQMVTVRTDEIGETAAFYRLGAAGYTVNTVTAQASSATAVTFTSKSDPRGDLWGHWKFNEASGAVAEDSSDVGHDGALRNTPTRIARYTGEGALQVNGATAESGDNEDVGIENIEAYDFEGTNFSLAAWVKFTEVSTVSGSTGRRIVGKGGLDGGYFVGLEGDGKITVGVGASDPGAAESLHFKTVEEFDDNGWHQIVVVVDQVNATASIYVDGVAQELEKVTGSGGVIDEEAPTAIEFPALEEVSAVAEETDLFIGSKDGTSDFFKGGLDDVRLYRRALTAAEVSALYHGDGPLIATAQTFTLNEDTLGIITPSYTGGGGDTPTFTIVTAPTHGEAVVEGLTIRYYPNAHYNGADSLRFKVAMGGRQSEANITLNVAPVDDPPLISVGGTQSLILPATASFSATVTDIDTDSGDLEVYWAKSSGPGTVTFSSPTTTTTTASFSVAGTYKISAVASDGTSGRSDSLIIVVNDSGTTSAPSVALQAPVTNSSFDLSALSDPVEITASASAASGRTITKVEFYEGARKIGEDTTPDSTSGYYEAQWSPWRLGVFLLSAIATDSTGAKQSSTAHLVRFTVGDWFADAGMGPGNQGYAGSGGSGGIAGNALSGPSGDYQIILAGAGRSAQPSPGPVEGPDGPKERDGRNDNPDSDDDGDGLTYEEEMEMETNPDEADSDHDNTNDALDGWSAWKNEYDRATAAMLAPPRLPKSRYAVIDMGTGTPIKINKKGQVVIADSGSLYLWSGGTRTAYSPPAGYSDIAVSDINDDGVAVGTASKVEEDGSIKIIGIKWSAPSSPMILSNLAPSSFPPPSEEDIGPRIIDTVYPSAINSAGLVVGRAFSRFYFADVSDHEQSYTYALKWTGTSPAVWGTPLNINYETPFFDPYAINDEGDILTNYEEEGDSGISVLLGGSVEKQLATSYEDNIIVKSINNDSHLSGSKEGVPSVWILDGGDYAQRYVQNAVPGKLNDRMEIADGGEIWRNFKKYELAELVPPGTSEVDVTSISETGAMAAKASEGESEEAKVLVAVELKDIKKTADENDDVYIEDIGPKKTGETDNAYIQRPLTNKQIAWIEPHGAANNTDPEMPHLVAKLPGLTGLKVRWKLEVEYKRGNGYRAYYVQDFTRPEDTVKIPANGDYTAEMNAEDEWIIFETEDWTDQIAEHGFFGGTAKLYVWFPSQGAAPAEPFMTFRIGGKNPDEDKAEIYINSLFQGDDYLSCAYKVARHETYGRARRPDGKIKFYNQFWTDYQGGIIGDDANDMSRAAWAKGWPLYNLDRNWDKKTQKYTQNGKGGYGLFQLTWTTDIERKRIWNWQDNVIGAVTEMNSKKSLATKLFNALVSTYGTSPGNYRGFTDKETILMTYYNGMDKSMPSATLKGVGSVRTCWVFEGGVWKFRKNIKNYVDNVADHQIR